MRFSYTTTFLITSLAQFCHADLNTGYACAQTNYGGTDWACQQVPNAKFSKGLFGAAS